MVLFTKVRYEVERKWVVNSLLLALHLLNGSPFIGQFDLGIGKEWLPSVGLNERTNSESISNELTDMTNII